MKIISRVALGFVWLYEGLVPKILFLRADEIDLVQKSHSCGTHRSGRCNCSASQIVVGTWLLVGRLERFAVTVAALSMCVLILLVANGNPAMLIEPYGALAKDFCLIACAMTVWLLAP